MRPPSTTGAVAGRAETQRLIPSADVLRAFANQGTHLYAVTAKLLQATSPWPRAEAATETVVHLTKAGQILRAADQAWAGLTTATRPTHEFVTASRALFATLQDMTNELDIAASQLDHERALGDLTRAAERLTELLVTTQHLPERLVQSELLYAPATKAQPAPERLNDRAKGRLVIVRTLDTPELTDRWHEAVGASREAAQIVGHLRAQRPAPAPTDRAITRLAVLEP